MAPSLKAFGVAAVAWTALLVPAQVEAQSAEPPGQVVSANPFGLLLELFNAEYERKVAASLTAGVGGSHFRKYDSDYVNGDVFVRYYPAGRPLQGFALGVKAGLTSTRGSGARFGVGIDTNYSWLLGANERFYLGVGFGLKRLLGDNDLDVQTVPTVRFVNVGVAF